MKKLTFLSITLLLLFSICKAQTFDIRDFGATSSRSTLNTSFIQNAIDSCTANGGGTVYVPAGIFLTGTLELKSNVNLHLEAGAELKGSSDIANYKPYQSPYTGSSAHYGIIYAYRANNVSITGQGAINGNEEEFFIWGQAKNIQWGGTEATRQKENYRKPKSGVGDGPVTPKPDRPRQMVVFSECKNVLVRDVQLIKSPFWTLHFADCDGVTASGLKVWTSLETPNSDGIDITSCNNVIVSDCDVRTGDDAIAITGYAYHYEIPGYHNLRHVSENITITNCNLQSRSSGIRIGYIDQNTVRNIQISNINITNSNRGIGIFVRGEGSIENITVSQAFIETRLHTGDWWGNGEPIHISAVPGPEEISSLGKIKNVTFRDITCTGENGILLYGSDKSAIEDVKFYNVDFLFKKSKLNEVAGGNIDLRGAKENQLFASDIAAFYAQYVNDLTLNDIDISWQAVQEDYFKYGIHVNEFKDLQLTNIKAGSAPSNKSLPAVLIENGQALDTDMDNKYLKKVNVKE